MDHEEVVKEICDATKGVFETMLGLEVQPGEPSTEQAVPGPTNGVVSLVGMAGDWIGTGSISCSAATACMLSSHFLMAEFDSVNEDVLDAVAELSNMIIGNFKTAMEENLGPMGLSIPTVIFGRNFTTRSITKKNWTVVPFTCGDHHFDIHVCLTPNTKQHSHTSHLRVCQP